MASFRVLPQSERGRVALLSPGIVGLAVRRLCVLNTGPPRFGGPCGFSIGARGVKRFQTSPSIGRRCHSQRSSLLFGIGTRPFPGWGWEDEAERSSERPCHQSDGRYKPQGELASPLVPYEGTSLHRSAEPGSPPPQSRRLQGNLRGMDPAVAEVEFGERPGEPFLFFTEDKTDPGHSSRSISGSLTQ
jgi:fructose-1,6-bisphosphatase